MSSVVNNRWPGWNHRTKKGLLTLLDVFDLYVIITDKSHMCIVALYLSSHTIGALQHINKTNKTDKTNTNYLHIQINYLQKRTSKHYTNIKIPLSPAKQAHPSLSFPSTPTSLVAVLVSRLPPSSRSLDTLGLYGI